ncbi:MAG: hypothetical protein R6U89_07610 [Dehalococcoidia bacterium]
MKDPVEELQSMIDGMVNNIGQAEGSIALWKEISSNANAINENGYGQLFGRLQAMLGKHAIITICRLFEPPDDRYELLSLPVVLHHMRFTAEYLTIRNRELIIDKMVQLGHDASQFESIPDPWITQLVRKEFEDRLPDTHGPESNELSNALHKLKLARDKGIVYNELVHESSFIVDETDIGLLLGFAKDFLATIGHGYLDIAYKFDDGKYPLDSEAQTVSLSLRRLLSKAGILNDA